MNAYNYAILFYLRDRSLYRRVIKLFIRIHRKHCYTCACPCLCAALVIRNLLSSWELLKSGILRAIYRESCGTKIVIRETQIKLSRRLVLSDARLLPRRVCGTQFLKDALTVSQSPGYARRSASRARERSFE